MKNAFVLMTAMPPTKGHLNLIEFAAQLAPTHVVLCTQPGEPYADQRHTALYEATAHLNRTIHRIHRILPQEPEDDPGFWDMWKGFLFDFGFQEGDYIVASEKYGKTLAEEAGGIFMPYDINRELHPAKATLVREQPRAHFDWILPEFQPLLRKTVTFFGAESTGKTTLSKTLAEQMNAHWAFEWARPYLENVENVITEKTMTEIWQGQRALQVQMAKRIDKPFIFQDTDLYSTVGYWKNWDSASMPVGLRRDARTYDSDLYIITQSNIPFEKDPLRYGGDKRETPDEFWIDLARNNSLNYHVLEEKTLGNRIAEAKSVISSFYSETSIINYKRKGREYEESN